MLLTGLCDVSTTKTPCSFRVHGVDYLIVDGLGFD